MAGRTGLAGRAGWGGRGVGGAGVSRPAVPCYRLAVESFLVRAARDTARVVVALAWALALGAAPGAARAEAPTSAPDFLVDGFEPAGMPGYDILDVARSGVVGHLRPAFGLELGYVHGALEVAPPDAPRAVGAELVADRVRADLVIGVGFFRRFAVSLGLPFVLMQDGDDLGILNRPGGAVSGAAMGDMRLQIRGQLFEIGGFGLGLGCEVAFPTGDDDAFLSTGGVRAKPWLALDWRERESGVVVALNVGYHALPERFAQGTAIDDALLWALALDLPTPVEAVHVLASLTGAVPLGGVEDGGRAEPVSLAGALTVRVSEVTLALGGGAGLTRGIGAPEWRAFIGVAWQPLFGAQR